MGAAPTAPSRPALHAQVAASSQRTRADRFVVMASVWGLRAAMTATSWQWMAAARRAPSKLALPAQVAAARRRTRASGATPPVPRAQARPQPSAPRAPHHTPSSTRPARASPRACLLASTPTAIASVSHAMRHVAHAAAQGALAAWAARCRRGRSSTTGAAWPSAPPRASSLSSEPQAPRARRAPRAASPAVALAAPRA